MGSPIFGFLNLELSSLVSLASVAIFIFVSTPHILFHLNFIKSYREDYYYPHSTANETEALKSTARAQLQTANQQGLRAWNPGLHSLCSNPLGDAGSAAPKQANE